MIRTILFFFSFFIAGSTGANIPESLHYQAVIRDNESLLVVNEEVSIKVSLIQGSLEGSAVYVETHNPITNANGLINIQIGKGNTQDDFSNINWANGPYYIQTEIDPEGGTNYSINGISQIMSVPYALYSKKSEDSFQGDMLQGRIINMGDPVESQDAATKQYVDLLEDRIRVLEDSLGIDPDCNIVYGEGVIDIDGNEYVSVIIGNQEWMAENLKTKRYNNGDQILTGLDNEEWGNTIEGAFSIYPHEELEGISSEAEVLNAYGALYNWFAASNDNLCPAGWRVPQHEDFLQLEAFLISEYGEITDENVGNALKCCRQIDSPLGGECNTNQHPRWISQEIYGTNDFGFSTTPAGYRHSTGFLQVGNFASIWTNTEYSPVSAWGRRLFSFGGIFMANNYQKNSGFSVRCIKK